MIQKFAKFALKGRLIVCLCRVGILRVVMNALNPKKCVRFAVQL